MPLPNQWARCTIVYHSQDVGEFQMIFYYVPVGVIPTINQGYAANLADSFDLNKGSALRGQIASSATYDGVVCSVHDSGNVYTANNTNSGGPGGTVGDSCPDFVCAVIRKRDGVPGRSGIGRWRMSCLPEVFTTDNRLNGGGMGALTPLAIQFFATLPVGGDTWKSSLYSAKNTTINPLVDVSMDSRLGRISRRELKSLL